MDGGGGRAAPREAKEEAMASVVRWDPFRDVMALREEVNRLFGRTLGEGAGAAVWTPAVDVFDTKDAIVLKVELPGLTPADIDIEIDDNVLTIKGERRFEEKLEDGRYYRLERSYGHFSRSLTLPQGVRGDAVEASFEQGVLQVRVPKADEVKPRKISVSSTDGAQRVAAGGTQAPA
jgi:HSP20 family protein